MKARAFIILIVASILAAGCSGNGQGPDNKVSIVGSGVMVSQEVALSDFDRLDVGFSFDVTIHQGEAFSVTASVDENLSDYLHLATEGDTLRIGLKPGFAYDIPAATMRAEVVMPRLVGLVMNGSSHAMLVGFDSASSFTAELSGSSVLEGSLETETAAFTLSGSSVTNLNGTGKLVTIDICGNSMIDLRNFQVEDAELDASCNSKVFLDLNGKLIADASQYARVFYRGNPDLSGAKTAQSALVGHE
jgi:hypothetical protein